MEAKFTPGPWEQEDCGSLTIVDPAGGYWIAQVKCSRPGDGSGPDWEEALANAALIATAPEMYEALANYFEQTRVNGSQIAGEQLYPFAMAALAKARGET